MVARRRLLALVGAAPIVLLEAPGGYGKSTLAHQLAARADVPLVRAVLPASTGLTGLLTGLTLAARRAGLPSLADAIDPEDAEGSLDRLTARLAAGDGVVVAVDDVQRGDAHARAWLTGLAERLAPGVQLVIGGRRLGPELIRLVDTLDALLLGPDALRLDREEIALLLGATSSAADGDTVDAIVERTHGWPAAVALVAAGQAMGRVAPSGSDPRSVLRVLVEDLLETADPADRRLICQVVPLPLLSADVARVVGGPGALDRLLDAGLPVRFRPDGWGELPEPVRELVPAVAIDAQRSRAVAALYADRGEVQEAATLLRAAGDRAGLATILDALPRESLLATGLSALDGIVGGVPDAALAAHPGLLVRLVRAAERQPRIRDEWLTRALRLLPDGSAERWAVATEQAIDLGRGGDLQAGIALAETVIAATGPDDPATLGRARYVRGLLRLVAETSSMTDDSAVEFEAAIALLRTAGERAWEGDAWQALGFGCWFMRGALEPAIECCQHALALRSAGDPLRATTLTYLADVYTHGGRLDDAATVLREADTIARRTGDHRGIAYVAWSRARLAAERRDRAGVHDALAVLEAHPDGWFDQMAGAEALADAADMLAVAGDLDAAWTYVARAEGRALGSERADQALTARCRLETLAGDPAVALASLDRLEASSVTVPRDTWLLWLERAACLARQGDRAAAAAELVRAKRAVAAQDDPGRIQRREPELLAMAEPSIARVEVAPDVSVVVLGRFAVERAGQDVSPPQGRPATLVKLLALRGALTPEEAIDALWPDSDEEDGRARLRNLLNRVRSASGELIQRHHGTLVLAPGVVVDAVRFEAEADRALAGAAEDRVGLARGALARATGELLPGDRYAEWTIAPRERLSRLHLALLDIVAADAIARGDLDDATRTLDVAIGVDPDEEERYVRLGRVLVRQGRTQAARRVAARALDASAELDAEPGDGLRALMSELELQQV